MSDGRVCCTALTKRFAKVTAVDDLSFTAEPGAVTGLLGPKGAGTSTTLRMVLGLVAPTSGDALVGGSPFRALPEPARVMGAVLDSGGFHPARSGRAHLRWVAAAVGAPDTMVETVLGTVGLGEHARLPVGRWPAGQRRRLALAAALLGDPCVLVLDEPGADLDAAGAAWLIRFLRGFAARGATVLVASHSVAELERLADHVVVMAGGRSLHQGSPAELLAAARARVFVRCDQPVRLAEALVREGIFEIDNVPGHGLWVTGSSSAHIAQVAAAADVMVSEAVAERVDLEHLLARLGGR